MKHPKARQQNIAGKVCPISAVRRSETVASNRRSADQKWLCSEACWRSV
ncbi:hypothetical protein [Vibrio breoganii]|nr:hypothetical protein [Vibrio breoganii]